MWRKGTTVTDERAQRGRVLAGLAAEVAFAVLPLIVVLFVLMNAGHAGKFFSAAEWSFGASILFGQTLVRFVVGLARGGSASTGPLALMIALLIVLGLVPSLLVLNMTLEAIEAGREVADWLRVGQVVLFGGSVVAYLVFGAVGESWRGHQGRG